MVLERQREIRTTYSKICCYIYISGSVVNFRGEGEEGRGEGGDLYDHIMSTRIDIFDKN